VSILFVVVDNGGKTDPDLNLNREYREIEKAYKEAKLKSVKLKSVTLNQIFFSNLGACQDVRVLIRPFGQKTSSQ
jgi:hypothetical protein